jgi:hypothetical protein
LLRQLSDRRHHFTGWSNAALSWHLICWGCPSSQVVEVLVHGYLEVTVPEDQRLRPARGVLCSYNKNPAKKMHREVFSRSLTDSAWFLISRVTPFLLTWNE